MATPTTPLTEAEQLKQVPQDPAVREAVCRQAERQAAALPALQPPDRAGLEALATAALAELDLPACFTGFAMVQVSNAFWREQLHCVPFSRRLLLLPHCLRHPLRCQGSYDAAGLHCARCGACPLGELAEQAETLGYRVSLAEGTSAVLDLVLEGRADAVVGVACLDSLEKSYERLADLGLPHLALPLLRDGCADTEADLDLIRAALPLARPEGRLVTRSYLPLLRQAREALSPAALQELLSPHLDPAELAADRADPAALTGSLAREWLTRGGKRLRPFVTLAAYAVARHGPAALDPEAQIPDLLPPAVLRLAIAIEALHKASLIHDDLEDGDDYRYGEPTLQLTHGPELALNVGDFLIGLGYRLVAGESAALGPQCVADLLACLSSAHLQLCRGQGAELSQLAAGGEVTPAEALQIGALKTAPAFEAALYVGLRAAQAPVDPALLRRFCALLGEAYQVRNDLEDWEAGADHKPFAADALARRPTMLRALACAAGGGPRLVALEREASDPSALATAVYDLYCELGVFAQAGELVDRLRERALALAAEARPVALAELLRFLVRTILPRRVPTLGPPAAP